MTHVRRSSDRRRRVLYTAHQADSNPPTAASRRAAERLREARRPTAAYGVRVKRRLRGRWFSLVPVRRRSMITFVSVLFASALVLCLAHYASVAWPTLAYRAELARPLRLDRPDSFGRFFICALLAGSAGASLLIYQLRRYRIDDYQGRYRLWRLVLIVMALASVNSLVSIIEWGGALVDAGFGRRVALSGSDWLRLVVSIGGAILALRLIAEVRRSRWSLATMISACALLAIPEAAKWNFIKVDSLALWTLTSSATLLAFTTLFVSLSIYLRMLYREVRQIDDRESLADRMQRFRVRVFQRSEDDEREGSEEEDEQPEVEEERQPKRRWWRRRHSDQEPIDQVETEEEDEEDELDESSETEDSVDESDETAAEDPKPRGRRGWFGRRKRNQPAASEESQENTSEEDESVEDSADESGDTKANIRRRKRRRFSLRLEPANSTQSDSEDSEEEVPTESSEEQPKAKRGLGGWFGKRKSTSTEEDVPEEESSTDEEPAASSQENEEEEINPDEIDWNSLSKSERRRLRKKLKRQNRAA